MFHIVCRVEYTSLTLPRLFSYTWRDQSRFAGCSTSGWSTTTTTTQTIVGERDMS